MSHQVDERVVSMKLENEQFEQGIKQSEQSVHSFNESLNNMGRGQALDGIAVNVAAISDRFSALGIIGKRVLENLTDSVMAFMSKTIHNVTDSMVQGGIRRAMNIENARFMLQGLMDDEAKVTAIMNDAMVSVTDTAYGYDEAAKAASMFAASGLEAGEELQRALRGVAGVAATTNSDYQGIADIFTTIAGKGKMMTNEINMFAYRGLNAAVTIKDYLNGVLDGTIEADEGMKKYVRTITGGAQQTEASVRDMVTDSKVNFALFAAAMDNAFGTHAKKANETFTGALANIKAALARIGADFVSPLIVQNGPLVTLFNTVREQINNLRTALKPLATLFTDAVASMATAATKWLKNLDITKPVDALVESAKKVDTFIRSLSSLNGLKNIASGLTFTFRGLGNIFKAFKQSMEDTFESPTLYGVYKFTEAFKKLGVSFDVAVLKHMSQLKDIFHGLGSAAHIFGSLFVEALKAAGNALKFILPAGNVILDFAAAIGRSITQLDEFLTKNKIFEKFFTNIGSVIGPAAEKVKSILGNFVTAFKSFGKDIEFGPGPFTALKENVGDVSDCMVGFTTMIKAAGRTALTAFGEIMKGLGAGLAGFLDNFSVGNAVVAFFFANTAKQVKLFMYKLKPFAVSMDSIVGILRNTKLALLGFTRELNAKALMHVATAIALLAVSLIGIASIDSSKLAQSLVGIGLLLAELMGFMSAFRLVSGELKGFVGAAASLMMIGVALATIAAAMKNLSKMSWEGIAKGLVGTSGALAGIGLAMKLFPEKRAMSVGAAMIPLSTGLLILSGALKVMGSMDVESIARSLAVMGGALMELAIGMEYMAKHTAGAPAMLAAAAAILVLAPALKILGTMNVESIAKSLAALGGAMLVLCTAASAMKGSTASMISVAAALGVLAAAMLLMAPAMKLMGTLQWMDIAKGLAAVGGALLVLGTSAAAMTGLIPMMAALAGVLVLLGAAMLAIAPGMAALGALSFEQIGNGLLALGGALAVMGGAAVLLAPVTPIILALSAALTLFGVAVLAAGTGIALLGTGLVALASLTAPALSSIGNALKTVIGLIPEFMSAVAEGIVGALGVLAENAPAIVTSLVEIGLQLLTQLKTLIPQMGALGFEIFMSFLRGIRDHIQEVVDTGLDIIINFGRGIRDNIGELVTTGMQIIVSFLNGVRDNIASVAIAGAEVVAEFLRGIGNSYEIIAGGAADMLRSFGQGIRDNIGVLGEFSGDLVAGIIDGFSAFHDTVFNAGKDFIVTFIQGFGSAAVEISNAGTLVIMQLCEALGKNSALIMWAVSNLFTQIKSAFAENFPGLSSFLGIEAEEVSWVIPEHLRQGIQEGTPLATSAVDFMGGQMGDHLEAYGPQLAGTAENTGANVGTGAASGVSGSVGNVIGAVDSMVSQVDGTIDSAGSTFNASGEAAGAKAPKGTATGINTNSRLATDAATKMGQRTKAALDQIGGQLKSAGDRAGAMAGEGLAGGISRMKERVVGAARAVASAAAAAMRAALDIHSPSKETEEIGVFFSQGFAEGIEEETSTAADSATNLANATIKAAEDAAIASGKANGFGGDLVDSIADGISENTSAEEAMVQKANSIAEVFKKALERADLKQTIYTLENDIWSALNPDADETTKSKKALDQQVKDLETETFKINTLLNKLSMLRKTVGEEHPEYTTAYVEFMREVKTYADQLQELKAKADELNVERKDLNKSIILWSLEHQDDMILMKEKLHMTDEEIREFIKDKIGATDDSYVSLVNQAVKDFSGFVEKMNQALATGNLAMMDNFTIGTNYAQALAKAVEDEGKKVTETADEVAAQSVTAVEDKSSDMKDAGVTLMTSIVDGMKSVHTQVVNEAVKLAEDVKTAFIQTVSKTNENGMLSVYTANNAKINVSAYNDSKLASKIAVPEAIKTAEIMDKNIKVVASTNDAGTTTINNNYNMTQNNSSPKALSNADIYRQTKTLLSTTKAGASRDVVKGVAVYA